MSVLEKVNILMLLVTISYIMALSNLLSHIRDIEPQIVWLITFFTSVGLFRLLSLLVTGSFIAPMPSFRSITATGSSRGCGLTVTKPTANVILAFDVFLRTSRRYPSPVSA